MHINDFYFDLPPELIAQEPAKNRDESRLMVVNRREKTIEHKIFKDIINYFNSDDVLVINASKVMPARLFGTKDETGASIEILLLKKVDKNVWIALIKPSRKVSVGSIINFANNKLKAEIIAKLEKGQHVVKFVYEGKFQKILEELGTTPLPPYIKRTDDNNTLDKVDKERYQTVYARYEGSIAAPTAGLHFTDKLLDEIQAKGVKTASVILHVGYGTFAPIEEEEVEKHKIHSEYYRLNKEVQNAIHLAKMNNKRVYAVGTTSARVLETCAKDFGLIKADEGYTELFIYPEYEFKIVDRLITNFHLPSSTLLMLVSAFAGKDLILKAYQEAIKEKYRFYSYGDAMLII